MKSCLRYQVIEAPEEFGKPPKVKELVSKLDAKQAPVFLRMTENKQANSWRQKLWLKNQNTLNTLKNLKLLFLLVWPVYYLRAFSNSESARHGLWGQESLTNALTPQGAVADGTKANKVLINSSFGFLEFAEFI